MPGIAESVEGVVYLRGNICRKTGSSYNPFTVPAGFRPSKDEYLPVAQSGFGGGGIGIEPTGKVTVEEGPDFANAGAVLTSLDGVSYTLPFLVSGSRVADTARAMSQENVEVVREVWDAYSRGDYDRVALINAQNLCRRAPCITIGPRPSKPPGCG